MQEEGQSDVRSALAEAIKAKPGHTATSLAKEIGRDGTYIRDFLRGKKRTLGATEIDRLEQLLAVTLRSTSRTVVTSSPLLVRQEESPVDHAPDAPNYRAQAGRLRDVPELGIAVAGSDGDFELNGTTIDYQPRPPALLHRKVFAVRVRSDSMFPRFREGTLLYVEQHREPAIGEDGIFEMYPEGEGQAGRAFVKELVSKNMQTVVVRQYRPEQDITYQRREIRAMYRVIPHNELVGV